MLTLSTNEFSGPVVKVEDSRSLEHNINSDNTSKIDLYLIRNIMVPVKLVFDALAT